MSMYLSCFVHEGIEQISVDLFEGMEKVEKNDELVEKVAKAKPTLVKTKSMIQIDNGSEKAADVLGYIQVSKVWVVSIAYNSDFSVFRQRFRRGTEGVFLLSDLHQGQFYLTAHY